ncbi:hypothetical protein, partial [Salmonella enterica]|uniref:hypothetical protein n=1 Tax=Salmonella enterica TaxID=28901 RepID=UPI0021B36DD5
PVDPVRQLAGCLEQPDDKLGEDDQLAELLAQNRIVFVYAGVDSSDGHAMLIAYFGDSDISREKGATRGVCQLGK